MSELPTTQAAKRSILDKMSKHYGIMPDTLHKTLVKTIFPSEKEATPEQVAAFLMVCDRTGLDPFQREIYAFPARGGGIVPVIGADGYYRALNNDEEVTGIGVTYDYDDSKSLVSCTARLYKGKDSPYVEITEFLSENKRNTPNWNQMPHRMLRHRALMQATRIACGLHGVYTHEEAVEIPGVEAGPSDVASTVVSQEEVTIDLSKAVGSQGKARKAEPKAADVTPEKTEVVLDVKSKPATQEIVEEMFGDDD